MKIPRDISGQRLISSLAKLGFQITRQRGSHIRLTTQISSEEYHISIPNHDPIKIGTLNNILKDISEKLGINKEDLIKKIF